MEQGASCREKLRLGADTGIEAEFRRDVAVLSSLAHSNIVQLFGVCKASDQLCLVMAYLPQGSLIN